MKHIKIAFLGTGLMGEPMAHRFLDGGFQLWVYNRTKSKTEELEKHGAIVASNPREAVSNGDVIFTMLSDYHAINELLSQIPSEVCKGKTFIQTSTISVNESLTLKERLENLGAEYLESPVLGSIPAAKSGSLLILIGGSEVQFKKWDGLLKLLGDKRFHVGDVGKAAAAKLAFNHLSIALLSAFSMSLGFVREMGVDIDLFMDILRNTGMYAQNFDKKYDYLKNRDFSDTNFPVRLLMKDTDLILNAFKGASIDTRPLMGTREIIEASIKKGDSDLDYSAIYDVIHPKID